MLKLDMSKAYDKVELSFLEVMLRRLVFNDRWVAHIMDCISTVTYSVQVRGVVFGMEDPLSPYLFFIFVECLSTLLSNVLRTTQIKGMSMAEGAPTLSFFFFFANDNLLFCNAHLSKCSHLLHILRLYEKTSGQKINFDKLASCFSPNTNPIMKQLISAFIRVRIVNCHDRYLGCLRLPRGTNLRCLIR